MTWSFHIAMGLVLAASGVASASEDLPTEQQVAAPLPQPEVFVPDDFDPDAVCPPRVVRVLAMGSSTMGSPLGKMLERVLKKDGFEFHRKAVASSGLARPDFFDWAEHASELIARFDPDVVVVQLGTNDFQPTRFGKTTAEKARRERAGRPVVRRQHPMWAPIYGERVDELLEVLGRDRERLILWIGPYAFWSDNALEQGPVIDQLVRERIARWVARGGHARYVNAWAETFDTKHGPIAKRRLPGRRGLFEIRAGDNIHLNILGVEALLRDPVVNEIRLCREVVAAREVTLPPESQ